ncbi:MAG TPA: PKD domain-containing protein, partial [Chitinophagaceae bacterium]|nr:PKD domain-containing protein [Chitinophagaceae bacterium]
MLRLPFKCPPCRRLSALLLPLCLYFLPAKGQQYHNWVFGNGVRLSFDLTGRSSAPAVVSGSNLLTFEGSASISDRMGNLLFYSNGVRLMNREHQPVLGSAGLKGHESTFQAALLLPQPGNDSIFFLVSADAFQNEYRGGYHYSVINRLRDSGRGEVVRKNVPLHSMGTERLTAAYHANGQDIWIITEDRTQQELRAWLLSCDGISEQPVDSRYQRGLNDYSIWGIGAMKVSPDGRHLCLTHYPEDAETVAEDFFHLFDFDNRTGRFSNEKVITQSGSGFFGCEFSPDSRMLYLSRPHLGSIAQYDISGTQVQDIAGSFEAIPALIGFYAMQLGPDGRIYIARSRTLLSVIDNPNGKGSAAGYRPDRIKLNNDANIGLPFVLQPLDPAPHRLNWDITDSCAGDVRFTATSLLPDATFTWDFGDGTTGSGPVVPHRYDSINKQYVATLTVRSSGLCAPLVVSKALVPGGILAEAAFEAATSCSSLEVQFRNRSVYHDSARVTFLWSFGDGNTSTEREPKHAFIQAGNYPVQLTLKAFNSCTADSV